MEGQNHYISLESTWPSHFALGQERRSEIKAIVPEVRAATGAYLPTARSATICDCQPEAILAPARRCRIARPDL